ncbi:MAG: hypothetical protein COV66_04070 [Nitrospinae bacterium CG11_big_fil_rev_8_21_14_0_20_45_15]|nr:MAG: hypothetical protein COV66_04070 [Nitrospinae bacterium CG11_big_fil_rev_8_21_14_0_20_45_15]
MVRIGVSVEGLTEERFIKKVLAPYLLNKGIAIVPISLGGRVSIDRVRNEMQKLAINFDYVTTLYDFYGFRKKDVGETKDSLESKISNKIHTAIKSKLIPYIQMYEFEGLLFSCPQSLSSTLEGNSLETWAKDILSKFDHNPEKINDSPDTAPSKRLLKDTNYRKITHGPNIAEAIGINKIREKCVGFNAWLEKLEKLP